MSLKLTFIEFIKISITSLNPDDAFNKARESVELKR